MLFHTLIFSIIEYGDMVLDRHFNHCIWFLFNLRKYDRVSQHPTHLNWFPILVLRQIRAFTLFFKYLLRKHFIRLILGPTTILASPLHFFLYSYIYVYVCIHVIKYFIYILIYRSSVVVSIFYIILCINKEYLMNKSLKISMHLPCLVLQRPKVNWQKCL